MNTPMSTFLQRPLRALCALGLTLAAFAAAAGDAGAYVFAPARPSTLPSGAPTGFSQARKRAAASARTGR